MKKNNPAYADMHIHTNCSDGTWSNGKLLSFIIEKDIGLFSITDHDNIENSRKMLSQLDGYNGKYVPGVEVNCSYNGLTCHITAYFYDSTDDNFLSLLEKNRIIWKEYSDGTAEYLARKQPDISMLKYKSYLHNPDKGGWKLVNFLMSEGIIGSIAEYFTMVRDYKVIPLFNDPGCVISVLKAAGAITFLAHPNAYSKGKVLPEPELIKWIEFGIDGIECYSSYCTLEESGYYVKFCKNHNLMISGGSDCHGDFLPDRKLGCPKITEDMIQLGR